MMDRILKSAIVEHLFKRRERRKMARAAKLDARMDEYFDAESFVLGGMDPARAPWDWRRDWATWLSVLGPVIALTGAVAAPSPQYRVASVALATVPLTVGLLCLGIRQMRKWHQHHRDLVNKAGFVLLRAGIVAYLTDRLHGVVTDNDGLATLPGGMSIPAQQIQQAGSARQLFHERLGQARELANVIRTDAARSFDVLYARTEALRFAVAALQSAVVGLLAMPGTTSSSSRAYGGYKQWERFMDEYNEFAEPHRIWGRSASRLTLKTVIHPDHERLPPFPGPAPLPSRDAVAT